MKSNVLLEDKVMRLSVRLAKETIQGINELKEILERDVLYTGLNLTNGFVVNQAYQETKNCDWETIIKKKRIPKNNVDKRNLELKTNLNLSQEVLDGITELKKELPVYLDVSYVTTSYVIRLIIKGALLNRDKENSNDNKK